LVIVTAWHVLADTHIAVLVEFSILAIYVLAVAKRLHSVPEIRDITGRGLCALGTVGFLCTGLAYLHGAHPAAPWVVYQFAMGGGAASASLVLGLWLTRPPSSGTREAVSRAMAREWPEFAAFHQGALAASLADVEKVRRKTEWDYWKLSAFGVPVAVGTGLALIISGLAGRPPEWLFAISALALLLCGIGAAILRWKPSAARREEILRELGGHLGLKYYFGGGEDPNHRTATVFASAHHARDLSLLPDYRELKLGAAFLGSRRGRPFVLGEVTTIPPRKLGRNTARMGRNFLLLVLDMPGAFQHRTIGYEDRGLFGHHGLNPPVERIDGLAPENAAFARRFKIFTDGAEEAGSLLTYGFMDAMMEVSQALPPGEIPRFAFDEGQFLLAIEAPRPWLDLDPAPAMAIDDPRHAASIMARLQLIIHIVDGLTPAVDQ
ncbi:MAG: DUF3137 domain-containing protein, partial [Alphaproteobacteria bacterium]